jgi:APA family basic amino acid/polyamine antiporter
MSDNHDLPRFFAAVHPRYRVPHRAEIAVGLVVAIGAALVDLRSALGFSSFAVLNYYAIANFSAWTLRPADRKWPRWLAGTGFLGCILLAFSLPLSSIIGGCALFIIGGVVYAIMERVR